MTDPARAAAEEINETHLIELRGGACPSCFETTEQIIRRHFAERETLLSRAVNLIRQCMKDGDAAWRDSWSETAKLVLEEYARLDITTDTPTRPTPT